MILPPMVSVLCLNPLLHLATSVWVMLDSRDAHVISALVVSQVMLNVWTLKKQEIWRQLKFGTTNCSFNDYLSVNIKNSEEKLERENALHEKDRERERQIEFHVRERERERELIKT